MNNCITQGVEVVVETSYQASQSNPTKGVFLHAYRISIHNHNSFTVQLISRKWYITNAYGFVEVVEGDGVVGRQPVLYAGDSYEYVSGSNMDTAIGKMNGHYTFMNMQTRRTFEVVIPTFHLIAPDILN